MSSDKLNSILDKCRILVYNASDTVIADVMIPYGYTPERLLDGRQLYETTKESFQLQKKEYTEQYYATCAFIAAFDVARKSFSNYVKIARIAFKNSIEGQRLLPPSGKIRAYSEFSGKASAFYSVIKDNTELLGLLAVYGVTSEQFVSELDNLVALEQLNQKQFIETGEAQVATEARNRNLEQLREFCSALRTVAKIALANQPQQLEKMGILARNGAIPKKPANEPTDEPKK